MKVYFHPFDFRVGFCIDYREHRLLINLPLIRMSVVMG